MVKMGNVWDRTVEVLNGRGGMLAGIALLTLFVPNAIYGAYRAYATPSTPTTIVGLLLIVATTVAALWGQLAIIAASTDPATGAADARGQANRRLPAAIGVVLVLTLVAIVVFLPAAVLIALAGFDFLAIANGAPPVATSPAMAGLGMLYTLVVSLIVLFLGSRLLPLYAVVLHERHGIGAIARSWRLTRRHTWRLFGTVLLFVVVLTIATWAAQSVSGLIFRLILGGEAQATVAFLATTVSQAVSTALTLVAIVFSAQLYVACVARHAALQERAAQRAAEA